jgi:hypothetical protein
VDRGVKASVGVVAMAGDKVLDRAAAEQAAAAGRAVHTSMKIPTVSTIITTNPPRTAIRSVGRSPSTGIRKHTAREKLLTTPIAIRSSG